MCSTQLHRLRRARAVTTVRDGEGKGASHPRWGDSPLVAPGGVGCCVLRCSALRRSPKSAGSDSPPSESLTSEISARKSRAVDLHSGPPPSDKVEPGGRESASRTTAALERHLPGALVARAGGPTTLVARELTCVFPLAYPPTKQIWPGVKFAYHHRDCSPGPSILLRWGARRGVRCDPSGRRVERPVCTVSQRLGEDNDRSCGRRDRHADRREPRIHCPPSGRLPLDLSVVCHLAGVG
jgi:hypothetical protein